MGWWEEGEQISILPTPAPIIVIPHGANSADRPIRPRSGTASHFHSRLKKHGKTQPAEQVELQCLFLVVSLVINCSLSIEYYAIFLINAISGLSCDKAILHAMGLDMTMTDQDSLNIYQWCDIC